MREIELKKVVINKESLFRVKVEKFEEFEESFFYDVYLKAAKSLNEILGGSRENYKNDIVDKNSNNIICVDRNINNIICFVGERGSGKTSVMTSFAQSLDISSNDFDKINSTNALKKEYEKFKCSKFDLQNIIDPSLFSGDDSIVELIIGEMFAQFTSKINNGDIECGDFSKRQAIIRNFEKVYKNLRILNRDKSKLYDENEDNLEALIALSSATNLKRNIDELIECYLKFVQKDKLVICIDDLDMKLDSAAEMIEDVRKYLILDNVIILMAVKFEQLSQIVKQQNINMFKSLIDYNRLQNGQVDNYLGNEISSKVEKYLEKVIPAKRRLYLPTIKESDVKIQLDTSLFTNVTEYEGEGLSKVIQQLLKDKLMLTIIMDEYNEFLIPNNLRGTIDLLVLLCSMESVTFTSPEGEERIILRNNIDRFISYVVQIFNNESSNERHRQLISEMLEITPTRVNQKIIRYLGRIMLDEYSAYKDSSKDNKVTQYIKECSSEQANYRNLSIGDMNQVVELFYKGAMHEEEKLLVWTIRIIYTLIMKKNLLCDKNVDTIKDVIAGDIYGNCLEINDVENREKIIFNVKTLDPNKRVVALLDESNNVVDTKNSDIYMDLIALSSVLKRDYLPNINNDKNTIWKYQEVFVRDTKYFRDFNNKRLSNDCISIKNLFEGKSYPYAYYKFNSLDIINFYLYTSANNSNTKILNILGVRDDLMNIVINQDLLFRIIRNVEKTVHEQAYRHGIRIDDWIFNVIFNEMKAVLSEYPYFKEDGLYTTIINNISSLNSELSKFIRRNINKDSESNYYYLGKYDKSVEYIEKIEKLITQTITYLSDKDNSNEGNPWVVR